MACRVHPVEKRGMPTSNDTKSKDDKNAKMDEAAAQARKELVECLNKWSANDVTAWWKSWYMQAGHKRLGRILVDLVK